MSTVFGKTPLDLDQPRVRSVYCRHLVELLGEEGVAPNKVLEGSELDPVALGDHEKLISYRQELRIYENAVRLTKAPSLGLRLGRRQQLSDHGVLGYALQSSRNLEHALELARRFGHLSGPLIGVTAERSRSLVRFVFHELLPLGTSKVVALEEMLAIFALQFFALSSPATAAKSLEVGFQPETPEEYANLFDCPVVCNAPETAIEVRAKDLRRPFTFADQATVELCERRCQELADRLGTRGSFGERVRQTLVNHTEGFAGLDAVAASLGISSRTLRRRLTEEGTSYRELCDEVRMGLAIDYLEESSLTSEEIAELLGYADTPSFYRSFRRWTGRAPGSYRR